MYRPSLRITLLTGAFFAAACVENAPIAPTSSTAKKIAAPSMQIAAATDVEMIPGQYLVMFKGNGIPAGFADDVAARGGSVLSTNGAVGFAVVAGITSGAATALSSRNDIQVFEQDAAYALETPVLEVEAVPADLVASPTAPSGAFFYARQWNMRAIHADAAWTAGQVGSASVKLAILDTGIDYLWPDLVGRVDLAHSISLIPSDDAYLAANFPGRHVISDLYFHGTHVSSTAVSNSNVIAGVTTATTLLGVKVCSRTGSCPSSAVLNGILYATDQGADIINMSLGGGFIKAGAKGFGAIINRVANYANRNGTLIIVSAGNEGLDIDHFPALYKTYCDSPNVLCIAATGPTASAGTNGPWTNVDAPTTYTNFGRSAISVAAPGGSGAGFVYAGCSKTSTIPSLAICATGTFIVGATGTSMSSPHVSGLAALLKAQTGASPAQLRAAIQQSADDLGQPGNDPFYGKGRINVARALGLN